jgi:hypothetical protein
VILVLLIGWCCWARPAAAAGEGVLASWDFARDAQGWQPNAALTPPSFGRGLLSARGVGADPILVGPEFAVATRAHQAVRITMSSDLPGRAELFWAPDKLGPYGGFGPDKVAGFDVSGDGRLHTYTVYPFWQSSPQVIRLRLDPPDGAGIGLRRIEVVGLMASSEPVRPEWDFQQGAVGWLPYGMDARVETAEGALRVRGAALSPPLDVDSQTRWWATIRMRVRAGLRGAIGFASTAAPGEQRLSFAIVADGHFHTYNVDLGSHYRWDGRIRALALTPTDAPNGSADLASLSLSPAPAGEADLRLLTLAGAEFAPRIGSRTRASCRLTNAGGETAYDARVRLEAPAGVRLVGAAEAQMPELAFGAERTAEWEVEADRAGKARFVARAFIADREVASRAITVEFRPAQLAQRADYVPEPHPVSSDLAVGAYYFPGWPAASNWRPLLNFPERRPVLGYYREGDPEVMDWQIKWAVEHGISFFAFDWYWVQGATMLTHGLDGAFLHARYRRFMNFCLLWANHNPPHTSSEADLLAVTDYWIDHYFREPNYLRVDGRPMVIIFAPDRLTEDMGSEAVAAAFEKMRARSRARGLPGLYLAACAAPAQDAGRRLAREGYDAITGYTYPAAGAGDRLVAPYAQMARGFENIWNWFLKEGSLPYLIPIAPGWDSRPWAGDTALVRTGNTPPEFEKMCRQARRRAESNARAVRMVIIEAWNEWGEGAYIEPHAQYGFGYLDAVRRAFTSAPAAHADVVPSDVGRGPYDVEFPLPQTAWEFDRPGDLEGWSSSMQMTDVRQAEGALVARSTGPDPAFFGPPTEIDANRLRRVRLRLRVTAGTMGQLFWSTPSRPTNERDSVRFDLIADGEFHDYVLDVGRLRGWNGNITSLRLDPTDAGKAEIAVAYIRVTAD